MKKSWRPSSMRLVDSIVGRRKNAAIVPSLARPRHCSSFVSSSSWSSWSSSQQCPPYPPPEGGGYGTSSQRRLPQQQPQRRYYNWGAFGSSRPYNIPVVLTGERTSGGVLKQLLPVGRVVHKGDIIALVSPHQKKENINDHDDDGDVAIASPETGRITSWYAELSQPIATGDALLELLVEDLYEDQHAWRKELAHNKGQVTEEFLHTYLQLDDAFRLQQIIQRIKNEWLTVFPHAAVRLYPRIAELQTGAEEAQTRTDWGVLLFNLGDLPGALDQLQQALQLRQAAFADNNAHPHIAASHIHLGAVYKQAGDLEKSLHHMNHALELQIQHVGSDQHPMIASGYNNVGATHFQMGHYLEAKEHYAKALEIHQSLVSHGQETADTAGTHHNLGVALKHLRETDEALEHLTKALQLRLQLQKEEQHGDNKKNMDADVAASHFALGQIMAEMGRMDEALLHFQSAVSRQERLYGKESTLTAAGYTNLGAIHYQRQDFPAALEWYRRALSILQKATPGHQDVAAALNNVGLALYQLGDFEPSLDHHTQGRQILEEIYGINHPILATTVGSIGNVLRSLQRLEDAMVEYQAAHSLLEQALGPLHPEIASSFNNIGMMFSQLGQSDKALESYQSAARIFAQTVGPLHPHTAACHFNVGLVYKSLGDGTNAVHAFRQARDVWQASLGPDHPNTVMAINTIRECRA